MKIYLIIFTSLLLLSCTSGNETPEDEILKTFIEPLPEFKWNSTQYQNYHGPADEVYIDNSFSGHELAIYYDLADGEQYREIRFWEVPAAPGSYEYMYAYLQVDENRANLDFLTDFLTQNYGDYTLIEEPDSATETRQWTIINDLQINVNYNFTSNQAGQDYIWVTYRNINID